LKTAKVIEDELILPTTTSSECQFIAE